jgi:DNA-binding SARP family transcriptional activator
MVPNGGPNMLNPSRQRTTGIELRTLGTPGVLDELGEEIPAKNKDLALLAFLTVENKPMYSRIALAKLLWYNRPQAKALHSLTQSLRWLRRILPEGALTTERNRIGWHRAVACDALELEAGVARNASWNPGGYAGEFLTGLEWGQGAAPFAQWVSERRTKYRLLAIEIVDRLGADAEARQDWNAALQLAQRAVEIEPMFEEGHRRLMRSWARRGERALALQHYYDFASRLEREFQDEPDPRTMALAESLRLGENIADTRHDPGGKRTGWRNPHRDRPSER